jgi:hypothetical protein
MEWKRAQHEVSSTSQQEDKTNNDPSPHSVVTPGSSICQDLKTPMKYPSNLNILEGKYIHNGVQWIDWVMNDNLYRLFVFCNVSTAVYCSKYNYKVQELVYVVYTIRNCNQKRNISGLTQWRKELKVLASWRVCIHLSQTVLTCLVSHHQFVNSLPVCPIFYAITLHYDVCCVITHWAMDISMGSYKYYVRCWEEKVDKESLTPTILHINITICR